jgi:SAM-dependent methyltransferase
MTTTQEDYYSVIQRSPNLATHEKYYWGYQYLLSRDVIVPQMMQLGAFKAGDSVAEIGCGEAGVLMAFMDKGATAPLGTDIATYRLGVGDKIAKELGIKLTLSEHDILFSQPKDEWRGKYNLVILRDVIEHLDDAELALQNIRSIIAPGGFLYVTFPPYNSPFGGHQHLLQNSWGKLPYMHLLPKAVFEPMISTSKRPADIEEVQRLRKIRLSPKKFLQASTNAGYKVVNEEYFLLRPVFKMKFGLPAISLTALKGIPAVTSFLSLEAAYLLKME